MSPPSPISLPLAMLDHAPGVFFVMTFEPAVEDIRLVYANHAAARRMGYATGDDYIEAMRFAELSEDRRRLATRAWPALTATGSFCGVLDSGEIPSQCTLDLIPAGEWGGPLVFVSIIDAPVYDHLREIRQRALDLADAIKLPAAVLADNDKAARLTERQREIATLLAAGLKVGEIAESLGVSTHTVQGHIRAIRQTLKITGPTVAGLRAMPRVLAALD